MDSIEAAMRHHRAAFSRTPQVEEFRRYLADDYLALARVHRMLGNPAAALAAARAGLDLGLVDPKWLFEVAGEIGQSGPRSADEAMAVLRRAIAAGFRDASRLASDPELIPLRSRADFQALRMDLEFPANPFARGR
jgi:hypothetical protein